MALVAGAAAIIIASRFGSGYGIGIAAIVAGIAFPIVQRLFSYPVLRTPAGWRASTPLTAFMILGSAALVAISFHSYGRPWFAFALSFILAALVAVAVGASASDRSSRNALPLVIVFVSALLLSRLWVYDLVGGDAFFHRAVVEHIATSGTLSIPGIYATFPLVPLGAGLLAALSGISSDAALTIYTFVPFVAAVVMTYEIGVRIHGRAVGLWAALLLGISRWYLYWGATETPMEAAFALFVLGVLCLVMYYDRPTTRTAAVLIVIIIVSAFLHPFSSLALGAAFVAFYSGSWLQGKAIPSGAARAPGPQMSQLLFLSAVVPVAVWIYHGTAFDSIVSAAGTAIGTFEGALVVNTSRSTTAYELDRLSDNILYGCAGLSGLLLLDRRVGHRSPRAWLQVSILFLVCAGLGLGAEALGLVGLLSFRWYLFATPMAALLAAWLIAELQRRTRRSIMPVSVAVACLAFLGMSNGSVNQDAPWYAQRDTLQADATADDIAMLSYLRRVDGVRIVSDWAMYRALTADGVAPGSSVVQYCDSNWPPGVGMLYELVALRHADYERARELPQPIAREWWLRTPEPFVVVYDNGSDVVWLRFNGAGQP